VFSLDFPVGKAPVSTAKLRRQLEGVLKSCNVSAFLIDFIKMIALPLWFDRPTVSLNS